MKTVNIHAAKTHLSSLVEPAAAGEEIIIAKAGKPVARLVAIKKPASSTQQRPAATTSRRSVDRILVAQAQ